MDLDRSNLADMPWWTYVDQVARGDTQARIAGKVGVTGPSVGRWAKGALPDPSTAAEFARQYGRPVLEAFVAAGFLTTEEARQRPSQRHSITTYDDDELVEDIRRRIREGGSNAQAKPKQKSADDVVAPVRRSVRRVETQPQPSVPGRLPD